MATLTNDQLAAMSFGYLNGADLIGVCSPQILIKQFEVNNASLQYNCDIAYQQVTNMFLTKYDVKRELHAISGARELAFVRFTAVVAIRNLLGNMAGEGTVTEANFKWQDDMLNKIREGIDNFSLYPPASPCYESSARLYPQNFRWLG